VRHQVPAHALRFPYNIRRGLGLWQRLNVDGEAFTPDPAASDEVNRGAYLVLGPGHCGECQAPRDAFGGIMMSKAFAGARSPEGDGMVLNITPGNDGIGDWAKEDIAYLLETGVRPTLTRSVRPWFRCKRIWRSSRPRIVTPSPPF
jgi:mono/diheme cytochrome c family protein